MNDFLPFVAPMLVAGALFLSVAAYARLLQVGGEPLPVPDRPLPGRRSEAGRKAERRGVMTHFRQSAKESGGKNVQTVVKHHLIDGLDGLQREMTADSDDLAKLLTALKLRDATLTNRQKIIADETIRPGPGGPYEFGPVGREC